MKLFKYWTKESQKLDIQGEHPVVSCWGGSNVSIEEASLRAREKLAALQERILQGARFSRSDYEVEIREEIVEELNPRNLISRNRYGALVLNSEDTLFIDIDQPPLGVGGFFKYLFRQRPSRKEAIIEMVRKKAGQSLYQSLTFRIYETFKGIRVIVTGKPFDPRSEETTAMFKDFQADTLYAQLCRKQNCFRARLTPKPFRAKCKPFKVSYPRTPEQEAELKAWVELYDGVSQKFASCRFIDSLGPGGDNNIVRYHDQATKATKTLKLA